MTEQENVPIWRLYEQMLRSRRFEQAVSRFWQEGKISGEMHTGLGEEAIVAGILDHLREGDALALDHRGTPPLVMRGVDLTALLKEFIGSPDGLCAGQGGHMHLFSREHLAASSGIVGAAGPTATGFALAARHLRPGSIAVAFFGDGAINQGMLLESFNLAVAWKLPVVFVCKNSEWAITTVSSTVTGGNLPDRARGFGLRVIDVDGADVEAVWRSVREPIRLVREKNEAVFVHARCYHLDGHFLGDQLLRAATNPVGEMTKIAAPLIKSLTKFKGAPIKERAGSLSAMTAAIGKTAKDKRAAGRDPIEICRKKLKKDEKKLAELEAGVHREIDEIVNKVEINS